MEDIRTKAPLISIWFGNFYRPAYDDRDFIKEEIRHLKQMGFNSIMLDSKAWEDFNERFAGGKASQYVAQQEYMMEQCRENGISYLFLALYLCADNLYPNIRFSPPIFGESVTDAEGKDGRWYKYWSEKAKDSMMEHLHGLTSTYREGMTEVQEERGEETAQADSFGESLIDEKRPAGSDYSRYPVCTMWDPIVAPSFDEEGRQRYISWLAQQYDSIERLNAAYGTAFTSFDEMQKEDYWFSCAYPDTALYTKEDLDMCSPRVIMWADNMKWRIFELCAYFQDMQTRIHAMDARILTVPCLTQWGYFLNVDPSRFHVGLGDLWDTSNRGIDLYKLAKYVDCCHFISVPVTPDGDPDAYVIAASHSMMRAMNTGRDFLGGIFWGRYLYSDLYRYLTPCEVVGSIVAAGAKGYISYGVCGMDDGGLLHRMDQSFLDSLGEANIWAKTVIPMLKERCQSSIALLFPSAMSAYEPMGVEGNAERRLDLLGWYKMCCDIGFGCDIIDIGMIETGELGRYQALIIPENDCYFLDENAEAEKKIQKWTEEGGILLHSPFDRIVENCFGIRGVPHTEEPVQYDEKILVQGDTFCSYGAAADNRSVSNGSVTLASWLSDGAGAIVKTQIGKGAVYSFGFAYGYCYCAKTIPHVPLSEKNNELYPVQMMKTNIMEQIFLEYGVLQAEFYGKDLETASFANGVVVVNHSSHPIRLDMLTETAADVRYQYDVGAPVLLPHAAAVIFK
ncbi:MAG: hypothetical protein LIP12_13650 [Clostridiales bacterium]|nr:hypothetical protein [Clostridiales bacterium]